MKKHISKHKVISHLTKFIPWNKNKDDLLEIIKQTNKQQKEEKENQTKMEKIKPSNILF